VIRDQPKAADEVLLRPRLARIDNGNFRRCARTCLAYSLKGMSGLVTVMPYVKGRLTPSKMGNNHW
jgi:hypothetical protein